MHGNKGVAAVDLWIKAIHPRERWLEPVTCGIPWPRGILHDDDHLILRDEHGSLVSLQAKTLDHWSDGSIRWTLLDWLARVNGLASFHVQCANRDENPPDPRVTTEEFKDRLTINTGPAQFHFRRHGGFPFESITGSDSRVRFTVHDENERPFSPRVHQLYLIEKGPVRARVMMEGELVPPRGDALLSFLATLDFFAGSATVRFALTLRNLRKAEHPGNLWDLGQGGAVYLKDTVLTLDVPPSQETVRITCSAETDAPFEECPEAMELYQDSSGGDNWQSATHVNRRGEVPNTFCGYRLVTSQGERTGRRATPIVTFERGNVFAAVAVPYFWQNFPKAVEASKVGLVFRLFPRQYADVHEIQGGEQKTHHFFVAFARDSVTRDPLAWCRAPLVPHADPAWYSASEAIPYLTPRDKDQNGEYLRLVDAAIKGTDTFERKREVVDEYGWRHFGEIYADHEAVFPKNASKPAEVNKPLVSHYNNQYDPVAGFAVQYLRGIDPRWWSLMNELAHHVYDIDIYHTDHDKTAYNKGLFWHTCHYVDADTGTHRSYPRAAKVCGGGPADEHNYTSGLLLHHYLTGDPLSRQTALDLAQWVIDIDDGRKTVFRWLDRGYTGLASATVSPLYHGPGRGAGNSIEALLDGFRITREARFLGKAEQLIRRCCHPLDDMAARELLDAERRWSYTVFLQALGRYLDDKAEMDCIDFKYAYARASLLHYARWMAAREYPILEKPDILEYPTETWAAQDMRKSEVFKFAAKHASPKERGIFRERSEFFFRSSVATLSKMKTRTLARPVVLMLRYGYMHAYFQQHPETSAPPPPDATLDFGRPERFVPQRVRAKKRFLILACFGCVGLLLGFLYWFVQ